MSKLWLPTGGHRDLNIERSPGESSGTFAGGGWKLCWHITVSPWMTVDSMVWVLHGKRAAPHHVIGGRAGYRLPVVVQMVAHNEAGRALAHPSGPETNRANAIQVEICAVPGNARGVEREDRGTALFDLPDVELPRKVLRDAERFKGDPRVAEEIDLCMQTPSLKAAFHDGVAAWTADTYKALANLTRMIDFCVPGLREPRRLGRRFKDTTRFSGPGWVKARGHVGHQHCPGNTHYDPTTAFKGSTLIRLADAGYHDL